MRSSDWEERFDFPSRVENIVVEAGGIRGLETLNMISGERSEIDADQVVLAVGHSARDTFEMLHSRGVFVEPKPFSIGFRIEHPQGLIDRARFGNEDRYPHASWKNSGTCRCCRL